LEAEQNRLLQQSKQTVLDQQQQQKWKRYQQQYVVEKIIAFLFVFCFCHNITEFFYISFH
jgi:hypothetical protein